VYVRCIYGTYSTYTVVHVPVRCMYVRARDRRSSRCGSEVPSRQSRCVCAAMHTLRLARERGAGLHGRHVLEHVEGRKDC
jgi:hypothetical protein